MTEVAEYQTVQRVEEWVARARQKLGRIDEKEWELRQEMWNWLLGQDAPVPVGAFKDMLA
ncbi:MAG: hypothetical protein HYW07_15800 [Candidatus Latescibacteria bacterium]|nr:hypothetical protein [Candidatus Latescibacterota bacterium]